MHLRIYKRDKILEMVCNGWMGVKEIETNSSWLTESMQTIHRFSVCISQCMKA